MPVRFNPAQYLPEVHAWIESGKTLRAYCRQVDKPSYGTVYDWLEEDAKENSHFARARDIGEAVLLQECLQIADEQQVGEIVTEKPYTFEGAVIHENGQPVILREVKQADMLEHRKLRIDTRLKLLAKWNPKKYGEKLAHVGSDGEGPVRFVLERIGEKKEE